MNPNPTLPNPRRLHSNHIKTPQVSSCQVSSCRTIQILEGLFKVPGNGECADCKARTPRWASINLGIFICLQCSGIHRSLGVHISKVRSVSLDTWLPDQVAAVQSMGNERSNAYWEAELPPRYDRSRIENFIRAKYVEKRWIPRDRKIQPAARLKPELTLALSPSPTSVNRTANIQHLGKERKDVLDVKDKPNQHLHQQKKENHQQSVDQDASALESVSCKPINVVPDTRLNDKQQTLETTASTNDNSVASATSAVSSPKVDYANELFKVLYMDDSPKSESCTSTDTNSSWVNFESDEEASIQKIETLTNGLAKVHPEPTVEDFPKPSVSLTSRHSHIHHEHPRNDKLGLPQQTSSTPPASSPICLQGPTVQPNDGFSSTNSARIIPHGGLPSSIPAQYSISGLQQPSLNRGTVNHTRPTHIPMQNTQPPVKNTPIAMASPLSRSAMGATRIPTNPAGSPRATLPVSGNNYDFSFLTQGMFTKR